MYINIYLYFYIYIYIKNGYIYIQYQLNILYKLNLCFGLIVLYDI